MTRDDNDAEQRQEIRLLSEQVDAANTELLTRAKEIARLTDIITRESWLEWANQNDVASPYVPWDQYADVKAEIGRLTDKLATLELACGAAVQDAAAKGEALQQVERKVWNRVITQLSNRGMNYLLAGEDDRSTVSLELDALIDWCREQANKLKEPT